MLATMNTFSRTVAAIRAAAAACSQPGSRGSLVAIQDVSKAVAIQDASKAVAIQDGVSFPTTLQEQPRHLDIGEVLSIMRQSAQSAA